MNYEVIVIGELCIDNFVIGEVNRLSPEAPIPIINPIENIENNGMAGNVFNNIKALAPNLNSILIHQKDKIRKTRFVDKVSGYILIRVDENDSIKKRINIKKIKTLIKKNKNTLRAVVISDYNKGFLDEKDIELITNTCKQLNINVYLDTKKILGFWSININFVKINEKEYELQKKDNDKPTKYCGNLIVTRAAKGSEWINQNKIVETEKIDVRDVAGAGDTYLAAFVIKHIQTNDVLISMEYANKAASYAVSKQGVVIVSKSDIP